MKLLAIETASNACSVAVSGAGQVVVRHTVEPRAHTRILVPMIREALAEAGLRTGDLDHVVLGNGPGSFIGMRIGASVAQGVAFAAGATLIPVSSLAAVAFQVHEEHNAARVVVAQDARMNELYTGRYEADAGGMPVLQGEEAIEPIGPLANLEGEWTGAGAAWGQISALEAANRDRVKTVVDVEFPNAAYVARLGEAMSAKAIPPGQLVPAYLRSKVAERPA